MIRLRERSAAIHAAAERAAALVVGDPDAGMHARLLRAYGCGDICVVIHGCPQCPVTVIADITLGPIPDLLDDSAVVFVTCVLECVTDLDAALREIARIAGSPDHFFIVNVQPWTLTARRAGRRVDRLRHRRLQRGPLPEHRRRVAQPTKSATTR